VGFFRRQESLHERLAREGGLLAEQAEAEPLDPRPPTLETGIHGMPRPRTWDATLTADVEEVDGDAVTFVALPDSTLLVEDGPEDVRVEPLAEAVEREVAPPYRARAVRQGESLWAVQAKRIEVLSLPDAPQGDVLDLTRTPDDGAELRVDGERVFGSVPALEERGAKESSSYAVHAERLDGDLFEVRASAL
jgi:hypothetical protein